MDLTNRQPDRQKKTDRQTKQTDRQKRAGRRTEKGRQADNLFSYRFYFYVCYNFLNTNQSLQTTKSLTNNRLDRQTDRQTDRKGRQTEKADRQTDKTGRQTKKAGRQTDRQFFIHPKMHGHLWPLPSCTVVPQKLNRTTRYYLLSTYTTVQTTFPCDLRKQLGFLPVKFVPFAPYCIPGCNDNFADFMQ